MASASPEKNDTVDMAKHEERVTSTGGDVADNDDEATLPLGQAIRRYPKVAGYSCVVTLAILLWGYDLAIVGTVSSIPAFQ